MDIYFSQDESEVEEVGDIDEDLPEGFPSKKDAACLSLVSFITKFTKTNNTNVGPGIDGTPTKAGIRKFLKLIWVQDLKDGVTVRVGFDFGSSFGGLMSYLCLLLKYFMVGVEWENQRYAYAKLYQQKLLGESKKPGQHVREVFKDLSYNMSFMRQNANSNEYFDWLDSLGPELLTVTLVFWFSSGWNPEDGQQYTGILLRLTNLRHLVTDWTSAELTDFGLGTYHT